MTATDWQKGLYRARNGMVFGVCQGVSNYLGTNVTVLRILLVVLVLFSGLFPCVVIYFIAALLMKQEPVVPFEKETDREFYDSYSTSRDMALHRLRSTYENLDRRIRRIETVVTSRDFDWDQRMNGDDA